MNVDYSLYVLTDEDIMTVNSVEESVRLALEGGATLIQLREKTADEETFLKKALAVKKITDAYDVPLIINDNVNVALKSDAAGVHLGLEDMDPEQARRILGPDKIIGLSVHNVAEALEGERKGADYFGVGAMMPTDSKKDAEVISFDTLTSILKATSLPVVIIGGVNESTMSRWNGMGIAGISVISAVVGKPDITAAARHLKDKWMVRRPEFDGVIFDLDGTLLDSSDLWVNVDWDFLGKRNLTAPQEYFAKMSGMSIEQGAKYTNDYFQLGERVEDIIDEYFRIATVAYGEHVPATFGAEELLRRFKEMGIPMVAATMNEEPLVMSCLDRLGFLPYFEDILTQQHVKGSKASPEIYLKAAKALDTPPEKTLVFEDLVLGVQTANRAGFITVGVRDDKGAQDQIALQREAHIYLDHLGEFHERIVQ